MKKKSNVVHVWKFFYNIDFLKKNNDISHLLETS